MGNYSSKVELRTRSTQTFLETCILDADHKALEEHLGTNPVQQNDLDRCLLRGLQIVQQKEREMSHVAPSLTILLQSGAKWNSDVLLKEHKTPYHIICESAGDHHELLDLMIKSSQRTIIDTQDSSRSTAVLYAVQNANINCLRCLIANRADVNIADGRFPRCFIPWAPPPQWTPLMQAIEKMIDDRSVINVEIFDLLLDSGADVDKPSFKYGYCMAPILLAVRFHSVYCVKKLITKGARLDIRNNNCLYLSSEIARLGNVDLLKSMFDSGIDKDFTDQNGFSLLWYAVLSCNIEAVRYLLDLGVNIPSYKPELYKNNITTGKHLNIYRDNKYPCVRAVQYNKLEIVKLLEEYGSQSCQLFQVLKHAVIYGYVDLVSYLLNKYTYPLNMEYTRITYNSKLPCILLTEYIRSSATRIIKLLLDHGADPTKTMSSATSVNAIMTSITYGNSKVIAQYIRSGVDINFRSYDGSHKNILPFEASVLRGYHNVAEILLISGCSCGMFSLESNHEFKDNLTPEVEKLMREWKVQENNVTPLRLRCRNVILNHLSPKADMEIEKLPLPRWLIQFLGIPEVDDIEDA